MTAVGLDREDAYHPAHELALKMLCAGIANAVGSMVTNPADLTKVRQQLYIKQAAERLSPSFPATLARMVREEGFLSIYKGLTASMAREMSYSSIRMGMYDLFKTTITKANPRIDQHSMTVKLLAGMGSGCLGAAVANPADLVKVRLQAVGNTMTLSQHVLDIYRRQGIAGYWRGVVPTVFRAGILTSSQLGSYDGTKQFFKREMPKRFPEGFRTHLICSGIAGFVCSVASAPVDTIKVRMMNDSKRQYKNAVHATALLLRYEGPFALYKGFFGCWIRLWPQTVISLITMEKLRKIVGLNPI